MESSNNTESKELLNEIKNNCEFCNDGKRIYIGNDNMVSIDNYYNQLLVSHIKKKSKIVGIININYCPVCGRKLREEKDD